ncbi:MAG: hypothetical protein WCG44_04800 [bacterium]
MKKLYSSIFYILCSMFLFATPVSAKVMIQEKGTLTIPATETIDDDLFITSESVNIDGTVTGDVFVGAGTVTVSGNIKGGLFVGTGDLSLSGATIGNSLIVGAGNVMIDKESKIGGSLIAGAGNLKNSAPIGRSAMIGAGSLYLDNKVGKEARLGAGTIELGPKAIIAGDLIYALGDETSTLNQSETSTVAGTTTRFVQPESAKKDMAKAKEDFGKFGQVMHGGWLMISFLGSLLIGFLLLKLFPKTMHNLSTHLLSTVGSSVGTGLLITLFAFPVFLVLALTIIGLPLAGMLVLLLWFELHLAKLIASYALGNFAAKQFNFNRLGVYATFALGLVAFYLLHAVPGVGTLASLLFTWAGLGAIWHYTRAHLKTL